MDWSKMKKPKYYDDEIKILRDDLKRFVSMKYPRITDLDACNWAFYPLNPKHQIGIDFWDIFLGEDNLGDCLSLLLEDAVKKGTVKDPTGDAKAYYRSILWLNEYFNEKYGGVENYINTLN